MKKNIIFFFSDQQRADTCGCYGQILNTTPNLDKLASEGVLFNNAFSPQPVCGPCRAIFQTGKYATQTGCYRNNIMLPHNVKTIANYAEELGYQTAYVGKWHLASTGELQQKPIIDNTITAIPKEFRGGYSGYWRASDVLEFTSHGYDGYVFDENNNKIEFTGYRADCITDFALDFFDFYDKSKPFFLTISHIEPHHQNDRGHFEGPIGSKEKFKNFTLPKDLEVLKGNAYEEYPDYLGAINRVDYNLGRLVKKLKDLGIYDDTIIIYTSDHGTHFKSRNKDSHFYGHDDYKRSCHDASIKVPLVIRGGEYVGGKIINELVSTESIPKTILAMMGKDIKNEMIGEDLLTVVNNLRPDRENEIYIQISESRLGRAIRTDKYKYSVFAPNVHGGSQASAKYYADDFLYDLEKDPYELENQITNSEYDDIKYELASKLKCWIEKTENIEIEIFHACSKNE